MDSRDKKPVGSILPVQWDINIINNAVLFMLQFYYMYVFDVFSES